MSRKTIAVLFGGVSVEHEISLVSSKFIIASLNPLKFALLPVFISKEGIWRRAIVENWNDGEPPALVPDSEIVPMLQGFSPGRFAEVVSGQIKKIFSVDTIFPVLHGTFGEDGAVQGLIDLMGVPCVGADLLGSSLCIDKIVSKIILRDSGIPVVPFFGFSKTEWRQGREEILSRAEKEISFPCFVKSSNLGSSVGVSKVSSAEVLTEAVNASFDFSERVIIERAVMNPREVEVSVMGNEEPRASIPGELFVKGDFYDYEKKYHDESTELRIPCDLNQRTQQRLRDLAVASYSALCCTGMARVDFLVDTDADQVFVSEINTIPGFTPISMYPKLWEASGLCVGEMLETLIALSEQRYASRKELRTDFSSPE
ncbi:MAG: D-alanine--D-alanine ligase [Candidatus Dadabacteria bacterium]|nr:D-alanine--D-alanine ligase [Candidatus Dadabacteria bacterium]